MNYLLPLVIHQGKLLTLRPCNTIPAYRKRGLATNLIQKTIEILKELGYEIIRLQASETAKPLYLKFGFKGIENDMVLKI